MAYTPPPTVLDKYADVLVNYGLNDGKGVKKGQSVLIQIPEAAKPLFIAVYKAVLKAGANPMIQYIPDGIDRAFFELANKDQLAFFPAKFIKGRLADTDHMVQVVAEVNKQELKGIDPKKIMARQQSFKPYMAWRGEKESQGKLSWTLALYGTEAMAKEANLSEKEYWQQIIDACYLDHPNPVQKWRELKAELGRLKERLDALRIEKLHIVAKDTDLWIKLGQDRRWLGGTGRNIPSFELFISPDWRGTEGHIQFTQPLYRYGNRITDVRLEFKAGKVVKATAKEGEDVLREMIASENADKVGEYSLTDGRMSRITKFMGETLFDENVGGRFGNTHLALGRAYKDSFRGDERKVKPAQWAKMGFNDSVVHTDIVATTDRTVTAYLPNGKTKIIYQDGKFTV